MDYYVVNIVLSLSVCFLLCFATGVEWRRLRRWWRPVLVAAILEQGAIAYGCFEADRHGVAVEPRLKLLSGSLAMLLFAVTALVVYLAVQHLRAGRRPQA